ncbi:MAG: MMPL family transporter [Thermoanaerobaculia bacterium]
MTALVRAVLRRRRSVEALFVLLVVALLPGLARLEGDNSPEVFYLAGSADVARYADLVERFGAGYGARVVLSGEGLFTAAGLDFLGRFESDAAALAGVRGVSGPVGHHRSELDSFPPADPPAFRARLLANRLDRAAGFVSESGAEVTFLVEFAAGADSGPGSGGQRAAVLAALEARCAAAPPGVAAFVVGPATLERALNESAREIGDFYFPLLLALAALLLTLTFREVGAVAVPLAFVAVVEIVVLGAMGYAGIRFNLVVAILPPILFVITLASAVHLMLRCRDIEADPESGGRETAAALASATAASAATVATLATYRDKGRALLWTTVSTLAGFASLAVTPVAPIRTLGVWAGLGLAFAGLAAFTLLPCLLSRTMGRRAALPERAFEVRMQRLGRRVTELAADHRGLVLAIYAGLAIVAACGLPRLAVGSNVLHYLAPEHPARAQIEAVERAGIGLSAVELVAVAAETPERSEPSAAGGFLGERRLAELARLAGELRRIPGLLAVVTASDLLDDVAGRSPLQQVFPEAELRARLVPLVFADAVGGRALARLLTVDGSQTRITLFVPTAGYGTVDPLVDETLALARAALPDATIEVTGQYPLLLAMQRYLISTLALSLLLTLPVLAITFYVLLREVKGTLYALLPNLWPVLVILGGMGWFGVPLDIATVMVASITLGLVVDNTIHTLAHYRTLSAALGARAAVADRMEKTAPAYLLTGVILALGFGVCALSGFAPTAHFGLLSAIAIVIAVAADFTLVPALFGGRGK